MLLVLAIVAIVLVGGTYFTNPYWKEKTVLKVFHAGSLTVPFEAIEAQFFTLFVLVAPYCFNTSAEEAAEQIREFVYSFTGNNLVLSSVKNDVKEISKCLEVFYKKFREGHKGSNKPQIGRSLN